ncbi:MAG: hypothetical protein ACOYXW_08570 [Actinomycetota bacterium]
MTTNDPHWQDAESLAELVAEGRAVHLLPVPPTPRRSPDHWPASVPEQASALVADLPAYGS